MTGVKNREEGEVVVKEEGASDETSRDEGGKITKDLTMQVYLPRYAFNPKRGG